jgi:LysM repeat protein
MTLPLDDHAGSDDAPVVGICPFLRSRDGGWSSNHASRELRCWAVRPSAQPAIAKQRGLCLQVLHAGCATFVAASTPEGERPSPPTSETADLWPATRTAPVALEPVRGHPGLTISSPRSGGQALLVGLMVLAFLVLVIARSAAPGASPGTPAGTAPASAPAATPVPSTAPSGAAEPTPSTGASTAGSPEPSQSAAASVAPSVRPSVRPSASPSASTSPSASPGASRSRTYTVRANDTLASIAARFNTTVKALATANNIADPRIIHVGQVLIIP